jgi:hypothetical protein
LLGQRLNDGRNTSDFQIVSVEIDHRHSPGADQSSNGRVRLKVLFNNRSTALD